MLLGVASGQRETSGTRTGGDDRRSSCGGQRAWCRNRRLFVLQQHRQHAVVGVARLPTYTYASPTSSPTCLHRGTAVVGHNAAADSDRRYCIRVHPKNECVVPLFRSPEVPINRSSSFRSNGGARRRSAAPTRSMWSRRWQCAPTGPPSRIHRLLSKGRSLKATTTALGLTCCMHAARLPTFSSSKPHPN